MWMLHRGERAWNPDGTVANSGATASGTMEEEAVLGGPVVLQVGQGVELWAGVCCGCAPVGKQGLVGSLTLVGYAWAPGHL